MLFRSVSRLLSTPLLLVVTLNGATVDHVQQTIEKWIDTKRIISETRRDWSSEQTLLAQEAKLLELELSELEDKSARLDKLNSKAQSDQVEAINKKERLDALLAFLNSRVDRLEKRVQALLPAFPKPLLDRIRSSTAKLGEREEGGRMSVSARMQALVGIISEAEQFNQELVVVHELRNVQSENPIQTRVLYWGLAGAYSVSPSGAGAQIGRPSYEGWVWEDRPEFAAQINELISIREGNTEAAFVQLPVRIEEVGDE